MSEKIFVKHCFSKLLLVDSPGLKTKHLKVGENDFGKRIDTIARKLLPDIDLSAIYKHIRKGRIRLNNKKTRPYARVQTGDILDFCFDMHPNYRNSHAISKQISQPLSQQEIRELKNLILYENTHLIAVNKPVGTPTTGNNSLDEIIKKYLATKMDSSLTFRPGPVHRLDRNTSGITIFATSIIAARLLSEAIKSGHVAKYYFCLFDGRIHSACTWEDRLIRISRLKKTFPARGDCGRPAVTKIYPLLLEKDFTFALCIPHTGRTHQIRAQASAHGHPLSGDRKYGGINSLPHYILHAACLRFRKDTLKGTQKLNLPIPILKAPLPTETETALSMFFGDTIYKEVISVLDNKLRCFLVQVETT